MKRRIDIQGITTTSAYKDGDCNRLINLRRKNGALRPVAPRKITRTLPHVYSYLFQHNLPQGGENLLGVREGELLLIDAEDAETKLLDVTGTVKITQLGNILNVTDSTSIRQLWWVNSEYKVVNANFQGTQTDTGLEPVKVELRVEGYNVTGNRNITHVYTSEETPFHNSDTDIIDIRKKLAVSLYSKAYAHNADEGRLTGYCMACTALELYDGSYVMQSSPVLLGMGYDAKARYEELVVGGVSYDFNTNPVRYYPVAGGAAWESVVSNATNSYESAKENIHAGISALGGINILTDKYGDICCTYNIKIDGGTVSKRMIVLSSSNTPQIKINKNIAEDYRNLIKSVSVFFSKDVCLYDLTKDAEYLGYFDFNTDPTGHCENYLPERKEISDIIKELANNQQFYKVYEIPFDDLQTLTPDTWITIPADDLKGKLGEALTMQEELPVDNFTHHAILPTGQYVYNSRLHIWDYSQELFRGWPVNYFYETHGEGQFEATETEGEIDAQGWIEYASVKIKTESGISLTVRITPELQGDFLKLYNLAPMLSYPDARATELTIYRNYYDSVELTYFEAIKTFKLTPSETHNFAYYVTSDLKPINYTTGVFTDDPTGIITEQNRTLIYRNVLKISLTNNPFLFPSTHTYTIGTGAILNIATNALRMSEGQFGQYNLYVFTSEGIYALDTGVTVAYNRTAPASIEIPANKILCSTPYGVIFTTKRGAYIINGQRTELITPQIEEEPNATNIHDATESFLTFLETLRHIFYDYSQNEVIFAGAGTYNWVMNFDAKAAYQITEKIEFPVTNADPDLYVAETTVPEEEEAEEGTTIIKDFRQQQSVRAYVLLQTRPLYFGMDEAKKLQRAIVRGRFINLQTQDGVPFFRLWGSHDSLQHRYITAYALPVTSQGRSYKDLDSGMKALTSFRSYSIQFEGTVDVDSAIEYMDFDVSDPNNNDKMR